MSGYTEHRADGWPLCPVCGEDELWSGLPWNGNDPRPPMQEWIDHGLRCYKCGFDSELFSKSPIVASVSSAIAAAILQEQINKGNSISIPSLGIVIPGKRLTL